MIATESNNLIGTILLQKLCFTVFHSVFYIQKSCLAGNGLNIVWCA